MNSGSNKKNFWKICPHCLGKGKIWRGPSRRRRKIYQQELDNFIQKKTSTPPKNLTSNVDICFECNGTGLVPSLNEVSTNNNYPHLGIIGGGIGGTALALACLHRGIPFSLFERDRDFFVRSQGYGLTLQQASKEIRGLGITSFEQGITSTRHVVHDPKGKIIGEWGMRKWKVHQETETTRRKNIHIARQYLRSLLFEGLGNSSSIHWGSNLEDFSKNPDGTIDVKINSCGEMSHTTVDLLVGADGIRSLVRKKIIGEEKTPLRYLGCMVILGICRLEYLQHIDTDLLDAATVFQTVNGTNRMYVMPYDKEHIMWQFSFPIAEDDAKKLSAQGKQAMKDETYRRVTDWHSPIPEMVINSNELQITGYPAYDRELFNPEYMEHAGNITLIGDAAHPMSPFKGQGANQALLDALKLARAITEHCGPDSQWQEKGLRNILLNSFEKEMTERTASKVADSALAVELLHSEAVLAGGDTPRGRGIKKD